MRMPVTLAYQVITARGERALARVVSQFEFFGFRYTGGCSPGSAVPVSISITRPSLPDRERSCFFIRSSLADLRKAGAHF